MRFVFDEGHIPIYLINESSQGVNARLYESYSGASTNDRFIPANETMDFASSTQPELNVVQIRSPKNGKLLKTIAITSSDRKDGKYVMRYHEQ